jgi:hypothetical protein
VSAIYTPTIVTRIPTDIDTAKHAEIEQKLDAARATLHNCNSYSRDAAIDMAAIAIMKSGVGACAYPTVKVSHD